MMSDHLKHSLKVLAAIAGILVGVYLFIRHRVTARPSASPHLSLLKNDKEIIRFDESRHLISVTTAKGTTTAYSRNPTVEVRKDGTIKVDAHLFGLELRPFLGVGYSDTGRAYLGAHLAYARQFDAGVSVGWTADSRKPALQPMLSLSWNAWSNTSLNLGANPIPFMLQQKPESAVFVSVRL